MNDEIIVEKLDGKIINDKKFKKIRKEKINDFPKLPFIKFFLIIIILFLAYLTMTVMLITFGIISIHQSLWNGNLLNGFSSMPWGIILFVIGFLMALPIIRYLKTLIKLLIQNYKFNKELKG